jgi:hypothetical protein
LRSATTVVASSDTGVVWPATAASDGGLQESQLRFYITVEDPDLAGDAGRAAREAIVKADNAEFFDHSDVEVILASDLRQRPMLPFPGSGRRAFPRLASGRVRPGLAGRQSLPPAA